LAELAPGLDLVLAMDPDCAPWGPRSAGSVIERVMVGVDAAVALGVEAVVLPCNTASVVALDAVRARLEPEIPVIGTVPAIKPAALRYPSFAVWATATTTASDYQRGLIEVFAAGREVTAVACHGLAEAIDAGDTAAIDAALVTAVAATPADCPAIVLGCTHYPLIGDLIVRRMPHVRLVDSAEAVARQTLRRLGSPDGSGPGTGAARVTVVTSGRPGRLPASASRYRQGRRLLQMVHRSGLA
jgi:glutamate racemase